MKVWYDACTGKHMRYGVALARHLRRSGHEVILTTREHPDTLGLAKKLCENPTIVGRYNPASLSTRLEESANRMLQFSKLFKDNVPDVAVGSQSVELCRIAFGLGIPIILTADTAYAEAANRLTIPLSNVLVTSKGIPANIFRKYGSRKIVQFDGVDEVAWIRGFKPEAECEFAKPLIVVRQKETKASYANLEGDVTERLAGELTALGNVLFLSRYERKERQGLIRPKEYVDSAELVSHADLVVGVGGTVAREAALQGIPTLVVSEFGRIHVNEYLSRKGFPLFIVHASQVMKRAKRCLGRKWDLKEKLASLENPLDILEKIIREKSW